MSNTTETAAVRVPKDWFDDAVREGLSLNRHAGTTGEGTPFAVYSIPEATRCAMEILIDRLRSEGWTIEPPRLKARPKAIKKLRGGTDPLDSTTGSA